MTAERGNHLQLITIRQTNVNGLLVKCIHLNHEKTTSLEFNSGVGVRSAFWLFHPGVRGTACNTVRDSHRIRILENALGVSLFHRIHRTVVITDAGRRFADEVAMACGRIESAAQEITRVGKSDLIAVHVVPSFAAQWLMPRLARFTAKFPDIDVRITASVDQVNLEDGTVDLEEKAFVLNVTA